MPTTGDLRIRVTEEQRREIAERANARGCKTISEYLRDKIFSEDDEQLRLLREIHTVLCRPKSPITDKNTKSQRAIIKRQLRRKSL